MDSFDKKLNEQGIVFNSLIALSNMPIGRLDKSISEDDKKAYVQELKQKELDGRGVDLAALVEIHIERIGQAEAVMRLAQINVEEDLLRATGELLGVHAHFMGLALLRGRRGPR